MVKEEDDDKESVETVADGASMELEKDWLSDTAELYNVNDSVEEETLADGAFMELDEDWLSDKTELYIVNDSVEEETLADGAFMELDESSIDKAPNDTVFLGRCSLPKSVQSVACDACS